MTNDPAKHREEQAKQHSCERNRLQATKYNKNPQKPYDKQYGENGVFFDEITTSRQPSSGNCEWLEFKELWQCRGVPQKYTKKYKAIDWAKCDNDWIANQGCYNCSSTLLLHKYPQAKSFITKVDPITGHFHYDKVQYIDVNNNLHTFHSKDCTPKQQNSG